jgi:quercetin dioxygenase-like cupin family protein
MARSIDIVASKGPNGWSPIRRELDVQSFGVNAWTRAEGEAVIGEHTEAGSGQEELYIVIAGAARFTVDGDDLDAPTGTAIFVDPESKRTAIALEDGTTVVVVGGKAGAAYTPGAFEVNIDVFRLFQEDKIEQAKEMITDALGRFEDRGVLTYNLACAEARLGETDSAVDHLRAALELRPGLTDLARGDTDLDALRADPRFGELVPAASS